MNETSLVKMSPEGIKKFLHIFNKFLEGFELDEYEITLAFVGIIFINKNESLKLSCETQLKFNYFKSYVFNNIGV